MTTANNRLSQSRCTVRCHGW